MSSVNDNTAATLAEARISEPLELPDRVYAQYADKPKARKWLELTRSAAAELAAGIQAVRECLDLDKATGQSRSGSSFLTATSSGSSITTT